MARMSALACPARPTDILIALFVVSLQQGVDPNTKTLGLATTANQDPCLSLIPLLGIDMWWVTLHLQSNYLLSI